MLPSFTTLNPKNCYLRMNHFENCIRKYVEVNKIRPDKLEKIKSEILSVYDEDTLTRQNIVDFGKWKASLNRVKGNENAIFFKSREKHWMTFPIWKNIFWKIFDFFLLNLMRKKVLEEKSFLI